MAGRATTHAWAMVTVYRGPWRIGKKKKMVTEKVKLSQCFNWAPRHGDVFREWKYSSTHSLTSVLDGGEWSASCPGRFTARERATGIHWIGGWGGPRAVLDAVKRKIPSLRRESNPRTPSVQPVAQRYTDWKKMSRDSSVGIAGLGIFLFTTASRTALGPTQPPIQWIPLAPPLAVKRPGHEADHSLPSNDKVKEWVELYLHSPICLHGVVLS
jgi:hypothetical protein